MEIIGEESIRYIIWEGEPYKSYDHSNAPMGSDITEDEGKLIVKHEDSTYIYVNATKHIEKKIKSAEIKIRVLELELRKQGRLVEKYKSYLRR